jgi:transcriptional regulator with XRE-family HTH domain
MTQSPPDPERHFAEKVARLQRGLNLSDEELAARANLDPGELEEILEGKGKVPLDAIILLAGALTVEPRELLDGLAWVADGKGGGEYRAVDPPGG